MADFEVEFDLDLDIDFEMELESIPNAMDAFYNSEFWFSYSSLKLLLYNPPAFYEKYINKKYEEKLDKHLINGKLIHCLILEPDTLNDQFIISPLTVPTGKTRDIIVRVFKHHRANNGSDQLGFGDYGDLILDLLVEYDLHQALVDDKKDLTLTGNKKRLAKMITDENASYFEYLLVRGNRNIVDQPQLDFCAKAAAVITDNEKFRKLMGIGADPKTNQVINETMYYIPLKDRPYGLKGIIDNKNIDHLAKVIYVNDFKTTGKDLKEFPEAVQFFNYDIQAVIYMMIVAFHFKDLIEKGYKVEFRFIAIDKNLQPYAFKVSETSLSRWFDMFKVKLAEAHFHYTNKSFDLPYAFANDLVEL